MKTFRLLATSLLVVLCTGFYSCSSDDLDKKESVITPEIAIETGTNINFTSSAGEQTLSFSTNTDWSIAIANTANGESWCSVTSISGKAGSNNVQIKVTENTGYDDRNVSLTIQVGSVTKTVIVTQKQKDALTLTTDKFEVGKTGGTINVEVKSNIQYEVIIPETSKSWIKQSIKTRGLTTKNLTFDIAASEEYEKREGEIIFQSGELTEKVHVYQAGEGVLLLTKNEFPVSDKGETITVEIKSNFEFYVQMPRVYWIKNAAKTRGMSSHTLYYTISPNETNDNREAKIVFYDKNSSINETLTIVQKGKEDIIVEVSVQIAGSLKSLIDENDRINITHLKISGPLNSSDFELLHQMATGKLSYLDIRNVDLSSENNELGYLGHNTGYFEDCTSLMTIILPQTCQSIGYEVFKGCSNLKELTIPNNIKSIYYNSFENCGNLMKLSIEDSDERLIIHGNSYISGVYLNYNFRYAQETYIGREFHYDMGSSGFVYSPFGYSSGIYSPKYTTINISYLRDRYFYKNGVQSIYLTDKVSNIGSQSFTGCNSLKEFIVDNNNINYTSKDGLLLSKDMNTLLDYPNAKGSEVVLPNYITKIGFGAFEETQIYSITIPQSIHYINEDAFKNCKYLQHIYCNCKFPPQIGSHVNSEAFQGVNKEDCSLYVPKGSKQLYENDRNFGLFKKIIEKNM